MKLQSQVSRAQLLRAWKESPDAQSRADIAELFGYEASAEYLTTLSKDDEVELHIQGKGGEADELPLHPPKQLDAPEPRPQVSYYYLADRQRYATEAEAQKETPQIFDGVQTLSTEELNNYWKSEPQSPTKPTPLTQARTMAPFVRKKLRQAVGRKLDVKALVRQVAKQKPLKELPTQPRLLPAGRVTVIADLNDRLLPFWGDIRDACELIKQKHGKIGLDIRVLAKDDVACDYYAYEDWEQQKLKTQSWKKIPAQSMVFILSDLGQLADQNSLIRQRWLQFVTTLNRRGIRPIVLAPIAAAKQCPKLQAKTQLILWQRFGQLNTQQVRGDTLKYQQQVEQLLAYLSLSPHVEPELLRSLCELSAAQDGQSGIEADVYLHPDVQWGYTAITLRTERREYYQAQFAKQPQHLKKQVLDCIGEHHASQFASVWAESILNAEKLMQVDQTRIDEAEQLMMSLAKGYNDDRDHDGMMRFARRHLSRMSEEQLKDKKSSYTAALYYLANRKEIDQGQAVESEFSNKTEIINQLMRQSTEKRELALRQVGSQLFLGDEAKYKGQLIAEFATVQKSILANGKSTELLAGATATLVSGSKHKGLLDKLHLDTGQENLTIRSLKKPSWASEITMRNDVLTAVLIFEGKSYEMRPEFQGEKLTWQPVENTNTVGFDEFGLFAEFSVKDVTQRLRYIEPTTFMMGSPEDEKGRYGDEDLHQVTLSQGYWLADTACTQELWEAVVGNNPSDFKDHDQNPVETVSWLDTQTFIKQLKQLNPTLQVHLPTEAQWENACRAGTTTPFSFDGDISFDRVNYRGTWELEKEGDDYIWGEGAKQKTVAIKSYETNDWGLYEMHGNVLEWCFDEWQANLGNDSTIDPVTAQFKAKSKVVTNIFPSAVAETERTEEAEQSISAYDSALLSNADKGDVERVLRGGSWDYRGRNCRSAFRYRYDASNRGRSIGFRIAVGLELPNSAGLRSNTASEQTGQDTARRGAVQGLAQSGSGGKLISKNEVDTLIESNLFQQSLRSDDGWKIDAMEEPLIDKAKGLLKGWFGRKNNEEDKK